MATATVSFAEFYAHYLAHHQNRWNRALHLVGTLAAPVILATAFITRRWWLLPLMPVVGYGCAWIGHFLFERNKPTAFHSPWRSFLADWRMVGDILRGRLR